jgi:VIT1/CCC1 family predicted Fe2+/Mn2+ transporter
MAAGEYVSVASQRDVELADISREAQELAANPDAERRELVGIYRARGLSPATAEQVASEMTTADALGTHVRDELGLAEHLLARPVQAAGASAGAFTAGALIPLVVLMVATAGIRSAAIVGATLLALGGLGVLGAVVGGAPRARAATRVLIGGAVAMLATTLIGALVGAAV